MREHTIENFTPGEGTGWFKFANGFNTNIYDPKGIVTWNYIPVGHASFGLCGGMVYAARDYYEAHVALPQCEELDLSSSLGDFIKKRQVDSVINTTDLFTYSLQTISGDRNSDYAMCVTEWSKIKATIDGNHPATLGLILTKSYNPLDITKNHQILAYSYSIIDEDIGRKISIGFYDPIYPKRNDLLLEFNVDDAATPIHTNDPSLHGHIYAFFESQYSFEAPPILVEGNSRTDETMHV